MEEIVKETLLPKTSIIISHNPFRLCWICAEPGGEEYIFPDWYCGDCLLEMKMLAGQLKVGYNHD